VNLDSPPLNTKVDCSTDAQWNMWVKVGVCKLIAAEGSTTSMTDQENVIVERNYSPNSMSPSNGMWNYSSSATAASASFAEHCTPSFQARPWGMEEDNALDQSGGDLLDAMEFNVDQGCHQTLNTSVSNCGGSSQLLFQKDQF
jgi:hypothetical protein